MTSPTNNAAAGSVSTVSASVVGSGDTPHAMFHASAVTVDGAFLSGAVFLEVQEEFTVELARGDVSVRVRARVDSLERGAAPGMNVTFVGVGSADRSTIADKLAAAETA